MDVSYRNFYDEDRRLRWKQSVVALAFAVLIHLGVIFALPEQLMPAHRVAEEQEAVVYEIDLVEEPEEQRFVEANPDALVNEPDRTDQYSFRAQQAADWNPLSDALNQPTVDGEEDSQKIIQGQLEQDPPIPTGVYSPEAKLGEGEGTEGGKLGVQASPALVHAQPLPAPDFLQQEPVSTDGPGSRVNLVGEAEEVFEEVVPDAPINVYRPTETAQSEAQQGDGAGGVPDDARPMPRARPRLAPELLTGPLMKSQGAARRRGSWQSMRLLASLANTSSSSMPRFRRAGIRKLSFINPSILLLACMCASGFVRTGPWINCSPWILRPA